MRGTKIDYFGLFLFNISNYNLDYWLQLEWVDLSVPHPHYEFKDILSVKIGVCGHVDCNVQVSS